MKNDARGQGMEVTDLTWVDKRHVGMQRGLSAEPGPQAPLFGFLG